MTLVELPSRKAAVPAGVFITDELLLRPPKKTDYLQEKVALQDLALQMADHPAEVLPHLVDLAIDICGGTSGGISLYEEDPAPGIFRWHYLRGSLEKFTGETTPRDFSPCGVTLDLRTPVLAEHPERFTRGSSRRVSRFRSVFSCPFMLVARTRWGRFGSSHRAWGISTAVTPGL